MGTSHQKTWGHGYHSARKAKDKRDEKLASADVVQRRCNPRFTLKDGMILWNKGANEIIAASWPGYGRNKEYRFSFISHKEKSFLERKCRLFIEAMHRIIRDGCEPMAVHRAFMEFKEYCDGCSDDMPGINGNPFKTYHEWNKNLQIEE